MQMLLLLLCATVDEVKKTMIRTYSELITIPTFMERYRYLKLNGVVGEATFGYDRYLNQVLYTSKEWRRFRDEILIRDEARDLGCIGFEIPFKAIVHHIDPITVRDVLDRHPKVFDPENVITVSHNTHEAIHFGNETKLIIEPNVRRPNDTCPWRR